MLLSPLKISPLSLAAGMGTSLSGPILWLEAGVANYDTDLSGNISSWNAIIGDNATQTEPTDRPRPVTISTHPYVEATESNGEFLDMNNTFKSMFQGSFTMFLELNAISLTAGDNWLSVYFETDLVKTMYLRAQTSDEVEFRFSIDGTTRSARGTSALSIDTKYNLLIQHDIVAQQISIYLNNVQETLGPGFFNGDTSALDMSTFDPDIAPFLNARNISGTDDQWGNARYGDIIFWNRLLTDDEKTTLQSDYA